MSEKTKCAHCDALVPQCSNGVNQSRRCPDCDEWLCSACAALIELELLRKFLGTIFKVPR